MKLLVSGPTLATRGLVISQITKILNCGFLISAKVIRFQMTIAVILAVQVISFSHSASAQQPLLDPSFNGTGMVTTQILSFNSKGNDAALQSDGKIVVAGSGNNSLGFPQSYQIAVVRYNTDGSLDTTFDSDGKVSTTVDPSKPSEATAVAIQPDDKIVVVGRVGELPPNGSPDAVIIRYFPNGSLDTSFDGDGIRTFNFDQLNAYDAATDVAIQPDGKIVIADGTVAAGFQGFVVARLNSDGSFDSNFGANGFTRTNFTNSNSSRPRIALLKDGRILLGGTAIGPKLVRFRSDGALDETFGSGGLLENAGGDAIRIDTNGKIVAVDATSQVDVTVRRYSADGVPDNTFGTNGSVAVPFTNQFGTSNPPYDIALQSDGKIVIGGSIRLTTAQDQDFALARLTAGGSLDTLFGFNGRFTTNIQGWDYGRSVLIQQDGKLIVAGESTGGISVARVNPLMLRNTCRPTGDFDGDGKSDPAYFNMSGEWKYNPSILGGTGTVSWGLYTDRLVPADFDGDCRSDFAIYRDGIWYIRPGGNGPPIYYRFGLAGDVPVPADYDGDDLADAAVYCDGIWYVQGTRDGFFAIQFGISGDKPVPGDYDGDGKDDLAVYRGGVWYLHRSSLGLAGVEFGLPSDKPVAGDYDGDGKTDIAVYRPSEGVWYLLRSSQGFAALQWGISTDLPVPADYDGDSKTDIAVYRNGNWYLLESIAGYQLVQFGGEQDIPVQSAFIR